MIILSSFLPAFAVLPPTAAGQAPVNRPYVGAPCSVNGVEMCFLSSDGAEVLCDFELVVTEECAENIGENGVEAYIVSYDGLNVSVFGSCLNATSYTTSYFSCYVDSSNLQTVVLEGSKLKDQLGFRHEEAPGLVK